MRTATGLRAILSIAAAVTILSGASGAMAEEEAQEETKQEDPWQQEEAVKLAKRLAEQAGDIRLTMRRASPGSLGTTRPREFRLEEDVRLIRNTARHLARQLEEGKGREETLPTARRVAMFIRDARVNASGWAPPEWIESKIDSARNTISELAALYGAELADVFRNTPGPVGADR